MDNNKKRENEWHNHPVVIFAEILVLYTAINSIIALFNL
ncbi:hypothetical protein JBW_02164 [Pelosinus fermentans JBW45]|uniref:Uncharacterized protein n=1 Tax=Pelosinus fermentans JBW45 TaxID=1192197 RepID=I9NV44_9FIRM|nr:hypothetical protein JBW_02164 [Pelosinus fermentans JBW45]